MGNSGSSNGGGSGGGGGSLGYDGRCVSGLEGRCAAALGGTISVQFVPFESSISSTPSELESFGGGGMNSGGGVIDSAFADSKYYNELALEEAKINDLISCAEEEFDKLYENEFFRYLKENIEELVNIGVNIDNINANKKNLCLLKKIISVVNHPLIDIIVKIYNTHNFYKNMPQKEILTETDKENLRIQLLEKLSVKEQAPPPTPALIVDDYLYRITQPRYGWGLCDK